MRSCKKLSLDLVGEKEEIEMRQGKRQTDGQEAEAGGSGHAQAIRKWTEPGRGMALADGPEEEAFFFLQQLQYRSNKFPSPLHCLPQRL